MDTPNDQLNKMLLDATAMDAGFRGLVRAEPLELPIGHFSGFCERYELIKNFQINVLELCRRSLAREIDPIVARVLFNEILPTYGEAYHRTVLEKRQDTPVFFRTDESVPGKITEIQCPGSGWGECAILSDFYARNGFESLALPNPAKHFAEDVIGLFPDGDAKIHYLLDNCALPNTTTYFIHKTRKHNLRYVGFDRKLGPRDANLIRSHTFLGLIGDCNFNERLGKNLGGTLIFDFPPTMIFDQKMPLLLPFWSYTSTYFDDNVRALFPHTSLITPGGVTLSSGENIKLEQLAMKEPGDRNYYLKYAGYDIPLHLESRGIYCLQELSTSDCNRMLSMAAEDYTLGKYWILQESIRDRTEAIYFDNDGNIKEGRFDTKYSAYYGPSGLLGIDVMHGDGAVLRQTGSTVLGICIPRPQENPCQTVLS